MNFKFVLRLTGRVLVLEAVTMLLPLIVALIYEESPLPFLYSILIIAAVGSLLSALPCRDHFFAREGFFAVGLIWLLMGVFGAFPFWFSGYFPSFVDCLFESISGFTTTGASILTQIEGLPYGILFWRSFTHWLGGMGVLVLTVALLPSLGAHSQYLMQAETPGPVPSKLTPKTSQSSRILYSIYCVLTLLQVIALQLTGMPFYDSVVTAFATAGTGGFSVLNASIGGYGNPAAEIIITVFMLLFATNFSIFFLIVTGRFRQAMKSDELRFFFATVALSIALITGNIYHMYHSVLDSLRLAAFQVASIISTTGFATANFDIWPEFSRMLLVILMLMGACAGSTGGGMKSSRILLIFKGVTREIKQIIHPRSVNIVKLDGKVMTEATLHSTLVFLGAYILVIFAGSLVVALDNFSFGTTFTAVLACISNIGPGLELVGPMGNYSIFSATSKCVLSLCMIIGRLEIFPILVLFSRNAWKRA